MPSTRPAEAAGGATRRGLLGLLAAGGLDPLVAQAGPPSHPTTTPTTGSIAMTTAIASLLSPARLALGPSAAATAAGDMARLPAALHRGLDAGLDIGATKEALVQLYAYAGFPRSLNALTVLMQVLEERRQRGIQDPPGTPPGPVPVGAELLEAGTANQTTLSGAPVRGPLFDFAPAIDRFLKTHLFGDIFARDNLDWPSRELVTVAALAALPGVESQLASHVRISLNVGITPDQLRQLAEGLESAGQAEAGARLRAALDRPKTAGAGPAAR